MSPSPRDLMPLAFEESLVRVIPDQNGDPLFVAKDVALALGYEWNGVSRIAHVPEEWRRVTSVVTLRRGEQEVLTLTEQGLYFFLGRSDKPNALPFQKWLAGEVLPALRKTGSYGQTAQPVMTPGNTILAELRRLVALWAMLTNMPSQSLFDQLCSMFGLQDEANDQQTLNAAALHVLQQNNTLLAQGRKVGEQAVARYQREIQLWQSRPCSSCSGSSSTPSIPRASSTIPAIQISLPCALPRLCRQPKRKIFAPSRLQNCAACCPRAAPTGSWQPARRSTPPCWAKPCAAWCSFSRKTSRGPAMNKSFLSQRLALVQEQQLELTMLAQHAKRGTGQQRRLALECLSLRQTELAADLALVAKLAAPRAAVRGREVAA